MITKYDRINRPTTWKQGKVWTKQHIELFVDRHLQSQTHWQLPSERLAPQGGVPKSLALLVFLLRLIGLRALLHHSLTARTRTPQQPLAFGQKVWKKLSKYITTWILDQVAMPLSCLKDPAVSASPKWHWASWWPSWVSWAHVWSIPNAPLHVEKPWIGMISPNLQ